jgi:formate dehydrogenase subunit delta
VSRGLDTLVYMANQIATFFQTQPGHVQAAETADHIRAFWEPRMRRAIIAHLHAGGEGLSPLAREAVARLEAPAVDNQVELAEGGKLSANRPGSDAG